jgi:hypothetical protein
VVSCARLSVMLYVHCLSCFGCRSPGSSSSSSSSSSYGGDCAGGGNTDSDYEIP